MVVLWRRKSIDIVGARSLFAASCCLFLVLGGPGCNAITDTNQKPTVAIALRVAGGRAPSPSQAAQVHNLLRPQLESAGYISSNDIQSAAYLLDVELTPDTVSSKSGSVRIGGLRRNNIEEISGDDSEATRQAHKREREFQRWVELQSQTRIGEGDP